MLLGGHFLPRSRALMEQADVVFVLVSDPLVELWIQEMRPDARSLQPFYALGKSRRESYREMIESMLLEVRNGRQVCGVFYGHPGVFAGVPHQAIALARSEGYLAAMEPGISAEDCLYADLGIDPGEVGCQHYEASQFMFFHRRVDPSAYLVLWQIGVAGDRALRRTSTTPEHRRLLLELLSPDYPLDHEVIAYEAITLPIQQARVERMALSSLPEAELGTATTLVIPPAARLRPNQAMLQRLAALEAEQA
jgi:hypothetical protein